MTWAASGEAPSSLQTSEFDSPEEEPIEDEQTPIQLSWPPLSQVNCSQYLGSCVLPSCKFKNIRRNIQKDTEELKSYGMEDLLLSAPEGNYQNIDSQTSWTSTSTLE